MDEQLQFYRQLCQSLNLLHNGSALATNRADLLKRLLQEEYADELRSRLCAYLTQSGYGMETGCHGSNRQLLELALREAIKRRLSAWLTDNPSREGIFSLTTQQREDGEQTGYPQPLFEWSGYRAHPLPEKRHQARFLSVDLSGELIIHDTARFLHLLKQGIGPAKGFGCGLMLVKPV